MYECDNQNDLGPFTRENKKIGIEGRKKWIREIKRELLRDMPSGSKKQ